MKKIKLTIQNQPVNLEFNRHFSSLARINQSLNQGARAYYQKFGLTYVDVPQIVGITGACENIDTLFKVQNRLDIPLFFTQTGQLALEQSLQSFPGVYTVIHSGRDEDAEDSRHLRQFRLTEEEFDCTLAGMTHHNYDEAKMFEVLLTHIQNSIQSMIKHILADNATALKQVYRRDINKLRQVINRKFLRITYTDAVTLLNRHGYPGLQFGDDLKTDHEAKIVALLNGKNQELPVFITHYPQEIKFFNMKVSTRDPRVVLSADLILPYAGEATGSAVREHDFNKLNQRLITSTMFKLHLGRGGKYEDFSWYLDIIKSKHTFPHAGYGIGNDRVLQYVLGAADIRHASLFSLLNQQTGDWNKKRYGTSAVIAPDKKYILLAIGQAAHRQLLLPHIKKLARKSNFILFATPTTHNYFQKQGIRTSLVYKISQIGQMPNISDLLHRRTFDMVINLANRNQTPSSPELIDEKLIRQGAVNLGVYLITDPEVARMTVNRLANGTSVQPVN